MPPGKLRHLINWYKPNMTCQFDKRPWFCHRYFRVNGMKDEWGVWRDMPSGRPTILTHFPEFNQDHGHKGNPILDFYWFRTDSQLAIAGDTLIWDAHLNRLYIDSNRDEYRALCYKEYQRECNTCPGFNCGAECTDAGCCMECGLAECACDMGFTGYQCQMPRKQWKLKTLHIWSLVGIAAISDKEIVALKGEQSGGTEAGSECMNTISMGVCNIKDYPNPTDCPNPTNNYKYVISTYIFDMLIACGGDDMTASTMCYSQECYYLDCISQEWIRTTDMPMKVSREAETSFEMRSKEKFWWVSGGFTTDGSKSNM